MQIPVIICDYQLEVYLISYNNSQRKLADGTCCDLRSLSSPEGPCFPQDTCDARLSFSIQNATTLLNSQTKVLGPYDDTDVILFPNCSNLTNGERNPLRFRIPSNEWNSGVSHQES